MANLKSAAAGRRDVFHVDAVDPGASGAHAQRALEPVDRVALAFDVDLDRSVLVIASPAGEALERRLLADEKAEADALHPASYSKVPRGEQNPAIILRPQAMTTLSSHSYGASQIRLLRLTRRGDRHDLRDLAIGVTVEGEIAEAFTKGDNELLLPADTLRNTADAIVRDESLADIEQIGLALAAHFMEHQPQFSRVRIELSEHPWSRLRVAGRDHGRAFASSGSERRTATVTSNGTRTSISAGIRDFAIIKTSGAAFEGYLTDQFTTLEAEPDRILAVSADATWSYLHDEVAFGTYFQGIRELLVEAFVEQPSRSAEHTAHAMASMVLSSYADVGDVTVRLRQRALPLVELSPFGLDNPHVLFRPEESPELTAEVTLSR